MLLIIRKNYDEICKVAAEKFADLIRKKPNCILGLATGSTLLGVYRELVKIHKEDNLDFSLVQTFNLDEYVGLPKEH